MDWLFTYARPDIDWNYATITLIVRFVGVFIVMLAMQVAMQVSARIVQWVERVPEDAAALPASVLAAGAASTPLAVGDGDIDGATAVAIGLALHGADDYTAAAIGLALSLEARSRTVIDPNERTSSWAVAGRLQQLNRLTR